MTKAATLLTVGALAANAVRVAAAGDAEAVRAVVQAAYLEGVHAGWKIVSKTFQAHD